MATSILKKNQNKSVKKPLLKLQNVLTYPYPRFWPEINQSDIEELEDLLKGIKPNIIHKNPKLPAFQFGLNCVLRGIKKKEISCLILSTEIKPKFIVSQLITFFLSQEQKLFVVLVPGLRLLTKNIFGISTLAFGVNEKNLPIISEWIKLKMDKFPIPLQILQYFGKTECSSKRSTEEINKTEVDVSTKKINFCKLYLPKPQDFKRAFIPENAINLKPLKFDEDKSKLSDYISLTDHSCTSNIKIFNDSKKNAEIETKNLVATLKHFTQPSQSFHDCNESNLNKETKTVDRIKINSSDELNFEETKNTLNKKKKKSKKKKHTQNTSEENFVLKYINTNVKLVQPNPDKKRKNKRTFKK